MFVFGNAAIKAHGSTLLISRAHHNRLNEDVATRHPETALNLQGGVLPHHGQVTEPRNVGPRFGDLVGVQQHFILAKSELYSSDAPSPAQSPDRGGGPTMRGGPGGP